MKWIILAIFLAAFAFAAEEVVVLTDENYESYITKSPIILVEFYAPWCGHCKELAPEYEKLPERIKKEKKNYVIAKIDATANTKAAAKEKIQGYPTLLLFIDGIPMTYEGERKADSIMAFLDRKSRPASMELLTVDELKEKVAAKGRRVSVYRLSFSAFS